jgi:WD repeat-containing protein 59
MDHANDRAARREIRSAFDSTTFDRDGEVKVNEDVGAASISPSGRDVVLAG